MGASIRTASSAGNRTRKVAPLPNWVSTVISPPSARTIPCEMGNPRPVPTPRGLVVKKESKILGSSSGAIPGPLSLTSNTTSSPLS